MAGTRNPDALELWLNTHLEEVATLPRRTRSATETASLPAEDLLAEGMVLSVHFSDGSVLHTRPQDWLEQVAPQVQENGQASDPTPQAKSRAGRATRSTGSTQALPPTGQIELPFDLLTRRDLATRAAGGGAGTTPIDRYALARLTPSSALDQVYQVGAWLADRADDWFGSQDNPAAGLLGAKLCRAFETSQLHPSLGPDRDGCLLRFENGRWNPQAGPLTPAEAARGVVLFLHGTASSTLGSYGKLSGADDDGFSPLLPADFAGLAQRHVLLAWEHRTLTASPLKNAAELAQALLALPAGTALHMVSHSRGGMVGDLISLALLSPAQRQPYQQLFDLFYQDEDGRPHADQAHIAPFFAALAALPVLSPGNYVRVAAPARGTLLADRRTDLFLSLLLRCIGLAFGSNGNPWYERFNALVRGLVAARADARFIPGLEAMIPGSPLTLVLNAIGAPQDFKQPLPRLPGALRVIAGDAVVSGWSGVLTVVGDVFYGLHDHDFVVHTHAMFGGFPRSDARSFRIEAKGVNHLAYFHKDAASRGPLFTALAGRIDDFRPLEEDERITRGLLQMLESKPLSTRPREFWDGVRKDPARTQQPVLVVLPGIMGSELAEAAGDGDEVWLSAGAVVSGRLRKLEIGHALNATGVMAVSYERLLDQAHKQFRVLPWPYDWRQPLSDTGARLRQDLQQLLAEAGNTPIYLLAHSMGGLVARSALFGPGQDPALWQQLQARGGRLLMLGTPNRGSYAPVRLLVQQHESSRMLAQLARKVSAEDLARWGGGFAGLLQMLPAGSDAHYGDLLADATWTALQRADARTRPPQPATLAAARAYRQWRDDSFAALCQEPRVLYVAGQGLTACGLLQPATAGAPLRFLQSTQGDGTVPWTSRLDPARTWYAGCEHGDLADLRSAFEAYFQLLQTGGTTLLPQSVPQSWRGTAQGAPATVEETPLVVAGPPPAPPSLPADLAAYVLGVGRGSVTAGLPPIEVSIVHGSLDYARFPLVLGHYFNDSLAGGTRRVDEKLDGQLQRMLDLKLFVGAERTAAYLRPPRHDNLAPAYPGALVVGLGLIGELTPASLTASVTRSVLRYAFEHLHRDAWVPPEGPVALRLSSLLIGTHMQAISPRDSLAGVLMGIWHANQHLDKAGLGRSVRVVELELIEISEYAALDAAYELERLLRSPDWQRRLNWRQGVLETRSGGISGYRRRDMDGTWQRLLVRQQPLGGLKFELIAERARVEATQVRSDVASLSSMIQQLSDQGALAAAPGMQDERSLGLVLYQLLLPQSLKGRMANADPTVLVLDDRAAAYPWELMVPPEDEASPSDGARPLAIQAGMIRQRVTEDFRSLPTLPNNFEALVVGNPSTTGWKDRDGNALSFADLPGAAAEAQRVIALMGQDTRPWRLTTLLGDGVSASQLRMALLMRPYRVLHLCAHGVVDFWVADVGEPGNTQPLRKTGVLLGDQEVLSAADVEQMGAVPEFVFINCCYSGREGAGQTALTRNDPLLASSLALQFIKMGSKAVVAAGWQVEDQAGQRFAEALYQALLRDNQPFGAAVQEARCAVFNSGVGGNTWGAYQCYGDPAWRFNPTGAGRGGYAQQFGSSHLRHAEQSMSAAELAVRVLQVTAVAGDKPRSALRLQLQEVLERLQADAARRGWLDDSQVCSALGQAYRELGDYQAAADWFQRGARQAYSRVTLRDLELAVNSLSRLGNPDQHRQALQLLDELDDLDLRGLPPSAGDDGRASNAGSERACLRGSALLRQARLNEAERATLLGQAAKHFMDGYVGKLRSGDSAERRAYALSNALLCAGLSLLSGAAPGEAKAQLAVDAAELPGGLKSDWEQQAHNLLEEIRAQALTTSFWHYTNVFELLTARSLLRVALSRRGFVLDELQADLLQARQRLDTALVRWPSPSEKDSITERFRLIHDLCASTTRPVGKDKLAALVAHADYALGELAKRN